MRTRFHGPYRELCGQELSLTLKNAVALRTLIGMLSATCSELDRLLSEGDDAYVSAHAMFVRKGRVLRLHDMIEDEDAIEVFVPATGG